MKGVPRRRFPSVARRTVPILCLFMLMSLFLFASAEAFTLNVVGVNPDGATTPVTEYRWVLEEDATYRVVPGAPDANTLAVRFHQSYMPVVASGEEATGFPAVDPGKHYFISVLPKTAGSYSVGGASFQGNASTVTVYVNKLPLPTAQITIFVFEDTQPINNAPDLPEEQGLQGFSIILEDAGGMYGISAGTQMKDAFDNPLGTTYQQDASGNFVLNPDGSPKVLQMGTGVILTDADGLATIKYLAPGKYGVIVVPPAGQGWVQTSTIEGTKVIDAWVKANEPPYFQEFGPPGWHVFVGFVRPMYDATVLTGGSTITGQVVNNHLSRPPDYAFYNGAPFEHTTPWVGLNDLAVGEGRGVFVKRCNSDGTFTIPNVPPGNYQLVVWDDNLDLIFAFYGLTVNPDGSCATPNGTCQLGDVPVFNWFTALHNYVFLDENENGFWDPGEPPIPEMLVNLRWRNGTVYQSMPTDLDGFVPFDEVFPFFSWLVAEVDYARFKATGVTVVVDEGGPIGAGDPWSFGGILNPQLQPDNGYLPYRTETGPVLTQAFQGFLGQTSVIQWGKKPYEPDENGGISGVVYYSTTRAENDPRYGVAEPWEPGIPNVEVQLYEWDEATQSKGALVATTFTDSWDAFPPSDCPGDPFEFRGVPTDCYDGLRNFNQVRPGVFDGGYAFDGLSPGRYVVQVIPPTGYEIVKEEDKNVDFGEDYVPSPLLLPPVCVGEPHELPQYLTLFEDAEIPNPANYPYVEGKTAPLCDCKLVPLSNGSNAAADFFLFTKAPVAGHIMGFVLDDTANEFDPNAPTFGEKYAPPWLPISIRDWTGREISRVYSDEYGVYNALVPSTYTTNQPNPSGMSPNMITVCLNSPMKPDPANPGQYIPDEFFNRQYSQFCYTFQYMPGTTTYLDTPVIPVAAFAGPDQYPLDCEFPDGTPVIDRVTNSGLTGPYVSGANQPISIVSAGTVGVPNPAYEGPDGFTPKTILRDFGFGNVEGVVTLGGAPLTVTSWTPGAIVATVPASADTGQLVVTRGDNGKSTVTGVTVTVGGPAPIVVSPGGSIQAAIDAAAPGSLILAPPGNYEELIIMWKPVRLQGWGARSTTINAVKAPAEKLAKWRAKIETLINGGFVDLLPSQEIGFGGIEPVTLFKEEGPGILVLAKDRNTNQGGFGLVKVKNVSSPNARIDGFTIMGADHGGGIMVNGYAHYLEIGNNRIVNNNGFYGGGIRVGHPTLILETNQGLQYQNGYNDHIRIHGNQITQNGGLGGAGGGISLCTGSDFYAVTGNFICGNFTLGDGGGIGHLGLSDQGVIAENRILFNESFNQGRTVSGGGIFIGGMPGLGGPGSLGPGAGSVKVIANLIQGNAAGAGDGGGIRMLRVNGLDVDGNKNNPKQWHRVDVLNNMIVNNVAALAGGALSLQDAALTAVIHNTIMNNDSTATAGEAFLPGNPNESIPQPAGVVSYAHSAGLAAAFGNNNQVAPYREFSNPELVNNIIRHNRSFYFFGDPYGAPPVYGLLPDPDTPVYDDLAVLGTAVPRSLDPRYCILTDAIGYHASNLDDDPAVLSGYFNGDRGQTITMPEATTSLTAPPAFDEGGNFIRVRFGPLTETKLEGGAWVYRGDYHIQWGSPARDAGVNLVKTYADLGWDYDGDTRPHGSGVDIGADEVLP